MSEGTNLEKRFCWKLLLAQNTLDALRSLVWIWFNWLNSHTPEMWLTCGARLLLLFWRSRRGTVRSLFLKSRQHVRNLVWVWIHRVMRPIDRGFYFRTRIILGTILVSFLVSQVLFRDAPGTVPESVCTCGFKRTSSYLDRAKCGTLSCWSPGTMC